MRLFAGTIAAVVLTLSALCPSFALADNYTFLYKDGEPVHVTRTNNRGVSVGSFDTQGLLLKEDGSFELIPMPPESAFSPIIGDINDAGEIVGEYFTETDAVGFIWKNDVFTTLQVPGEGRTTPQGLNNRGTVVGTFQLAGQRIITTQAFIYKNGAYTRVAIPGAVFVNFWDVNDAGDIVGEYRLAASPSQPHSFLYRNGTITPLPTYPGAERTRMFSINNRGEMTGEIFIREPGQPPLIMGFILRGDQFETFRLLGSTSMNPFGINDKGDVTGTFLSQVPTNPGAITEGTSFIRRAK